MITAQAWRLSVGNESALHYRIQVDGINGKNEKKLARALKDWRDSGSITNSDQNDWGLLFSREFESESDWVDWAKRFPYKLVEISSCSEKVKPIKLGVDAAGSLPKRKAGRPRKDGTTDRTATKRKRGRPKKRVCGHCGKKGHNKRTCPDALAGKAKKKKRKKGKTVCSVCGALGHNKRTCPENLFLV